MRIGIGYDAHRLTTGRNLVLGGVNIPYHLGLLGHSDADVLCHAIADALLGAANLGDIGQNFPDTKAEYKDVSSLLLLQQVQNLLQAHNWRIVNVDSVIIAQQPKLAPYRQQMCKNVAQALNMQVSAVSIKATTTEGLGFCGTEEGMAAQAIALVEDFSYETP